MNDWDSLVILFNTANIIFLAAFMAKKIIWLRLLTITGMMVGIPYYLYIHEAPMWNNIFWVCTYALINLVMLFVIYLESRPIKLSDLERKIYNMTFKSLGLREFKHLVDHGSLKRVLLLVILSWTVLCMWWKVRLKWCSNMEII